MHPLKNVNQSRSKAEVEFSAVGVGFSATEAGLSAMDVELSAAEVGPSAAGAELSTGEVVLSAVEVGVSAAELVSSPRSKKPSYLKKQLPASEYEIVEASQSSFVATCQSDSTKALLPLPQAHLKQSLSQNPGALHLRDCSWLWWRYIDLRI